MSAKAGYSTPLFRVTDVARSIRFYELLGFSTIDTEGECGHIGWARLHCEGGAIMLLEAEPLHAAQRSELLYMYTDDLAGLREQLLAAGFAASPISHPEYMPSGEIRVEDPDGYILLIGHWGRAEHESWERRLAEKRKAAGT